MFVSLCVTVFFCLFVLNPPVPSPPHCAAQFAVAHVRGHEEKLFFKQLDTRGHHQYEVYEK